MDIWGPNTETPFSHRLIAIVKGLSAAKGVHDVGKRSGALVFVRTTHGSTDGH